MSNSSNLPEQTTQRLLPQGEPCQSPLIALTDTSTSNSISAAVASAISVSTNTKETNADWTRRILSNLPVEPYYAQDGIIILNSDCRDILPLLPQVDLVLTDPPYGIGEAAGKNKSRGLAAVSKDYGFDNWDCSPVAWDLMEVCIAKGGRAIVFGGNYYPVPPSSCWLVWDKDNGKTDFADCELAWTNLRKAVRKLTYRWQGMLQENMGNKEVRYHPTQKPVSVMTWCLSFLPDAQTILDPFMGSGTTLVAAKLLGKRAIGIELEEKYCQIAVERLAQGNLFSEEVKW